VSSFHDDVTAAKIEFILARRLANLTKAQCCAVLGSRRIIHSNGDNDNLTSKHLINDVVLLSIMAKFPVLCI